MDIFDKVFPSIGDIGIRHTIRAIKYNKYISRQRHSAMTFTVISCHTILCGMRALSRVPACVCAVNGWKSSKVPVGYIILKAKDGLAHTRTRHHVTLKSSGTICFYAYNLKKIILLCVRMVKMELDVVCLYRCMLPADGALALVICIVYSTGLRRCAFAILPIGPFVSLVHSFTSYILHFHKVSAGKRKMKTNETCSSSHRQSNNSVIVSYASS